MVTLLFTGWGICVGWFVIDFWWAVACCCGTFGGCLLCCLFWVCYLMFVLLLYITGLWFRLLLGCLGGLLFVDYLLWFPWLFCGCLIELLVMFWLLRCDLIVLVDCFVCWFVCCAGCGLLYFGFFTVSWCLLFGLGFTVLLDWFNRFALRIGLLVNLFDSGLMA